MTEEDNIFEAIINSDDDERTLILNTPRGKVYAKKWREDGAN